MARKRSAVSSRSGPRQAGLLRQVLGHTWLAVILMGSGLFLVVMIALAIGNERGFLAMWRMQRSLVQLANDIRLIEQGAHGIRNYERLIFKDEVRCDWMSLSCQ